MHMLEEKRYQIVGYNLFTESVEEFKNLLVQNEEDQGFRSWVRSDTVSC